MSKYINADNYKELIEREKAECYPTDDEFEDGCKTGLEIAVEVIDEMPESIVRCKDCIYGKGHSKSSKWFCDQHNKLFNETDYCSYGEARRKSDDEH